MSTSSTAILSRRFDFLSRSCGTALAILAGLAVPAAATYGAPLFSEHEPDARALLGRMTLDEKIGQMVQVDSSALKDRGDVARYFLGSVLSGGTSDPAGGNTPKDWVAFVGEFQAQALKTRLGIPLLYGIDAVHGHNNVDGATVFPHHTGLGATHNPGLVEQVGRATAEECAGTGIRWTFAPCVTVPQDPRWGRTYEGYGDDPRLVSRLGAAETAGLQGKMLSTDSSSVLGCAKHYLGDGGTAEGVDQGNTVCDEATLRKVHLPPYRAAIEAGVGSIMVSFNSWNGEKLHGQRHLLTDILKGELGFRGFLVSDWAAIDQIDTNNFSNCIERSINAGLDMVMIPNGPGKTNSYVDFIHRLKGLVADGRVPLSRVDDAVLRLLRVKYQMGLFEPRPVDPALTASIGSPEHRAIARECVRESLVVLKNDRRALPLAKNVQRLVVVGAAADDLGVQCGGWTVDWQGGRGRITQGGTTLLAAIRKTVSTQTQVDFVPDGDNLPPADVVVVVVGEPPYAEGVGDRRSLDLPAGDGALIAKAKASGAPVVTVLYSGRPLILGSALDDSQAFVAAWLPGTEGQGVADVLFGDFKPAGKLPRSWPSSNTHLRSDDPDAKPLFKRGYGLTWK